MLSKAQTCFPGCAAIALLTAVLAVAGCDTTPQAEPAPGTWQTVAQEVPSAILSIRGTSPSDVWAVGADKGSGPLVLHYDGKAWHKLDSGVQGTFWWALPFADGSVFFGSAGAGIVRYQDAKFTRMSTPGAGNATVYGLWGASPTDVYAVGSVSSRNGFIWHFDGNSWNEVALPADIPSQNGDIPGLFKVWGDGHGAIWAVGGHGLALRSEGGAAFKRIETGTTATLFTVDGNGSSDTVFVGGGGDGDVLFDMGKGSTAAGTSLPGVSLLQGVAFAKNGDAWACGLGGSIVRRQNGAWHKVDTGLDLTVQSLHALWVDSDGGVWAVGGNVLDPTLDKGAIIHYGKAAVPTYKAAAPVQPVTTCPAAQIDPAPSKSIARRWNEQNLGAIRRDLPRPGVHARNLFHVSAAMWDAWAAYDAGAKGYLVTEKATAADLATARQEAISYAAYGVLTHRYKTAIGGAVSADCFDQFMVKLGYDPKDTTTAGDGPRALGNRIAAAVIAAGADDGANEAKNYADTTGYAAANPPMVVDDPGAQMTAPSVWQALVLAQAVTQNGIPQGSGAQSYIGAQWRDVKPFALVRPAPGKPYMDPGPAPKADDPQMGAWLLEVLDKEARMDTASAATIDISPGAYGNNTLGSNDGKGHATNPVTGQPYAPEVVPVADFARVLAEFWADGPKSETPPGHWNVIANLVADHPDFHRQLEGKGPVLDPLEWDVKVYFALNGAVHDAAIAAWEIKRIFLASRPISLIRYKAGHGQSSDPSLPAYDKAGLPLKEGLVELITADSSAPGQRHAHLARYIGQIAVRAWRGEPGDHKHEVGGVAWMRGVEWMPYQRRTFVTPAFPGFISGHSTFSRAGAEVLAHITGSAWFPGGIAEYAFEPNAFLSFEMGPSAAIRLQWGTYFDAADQAGQSRIWGGIHIEPDDFVGRKFGDAVGTGAYALAVSYFGAVGKP